jgi:hypothetical protein
MASVRGMTPTSWPIRWVGTGMCTAWSAQCGVTETKWALPAAECRKPGGKPEGAHIRLSLWLRQNPQLQVGAMALTTLYACCSLLLFYASWFFEDIQTTQRKKAGGRLNTCRQTLLFRESMSDGCTDQGPCNPAHVLCTHSNCDPANIPADSPVQVGGGAPAAAPSSNKAARKAAACIHDIRQKYSSDQRMPNKARILALQEALEVPGAFEHAFCRPRSN